MHFTPPILRPPHQATLAEQVLGAHDPFVGVLARYETSIAQRRVTLVITLVAVAAFAGGMSEAIPLIAGGAGATLTFGLRVWLRAVELREQVLRLIVAGRGDAPIATVRRELRRLLDAQHRVALADAYEAVGRPAEPCGRVPYRARVIATPIVGAPVRPDLLRIARLLRGRRPPAAGVAAAEQLLCGPESSLFGRDVELLRQDLHRVAFLLDTRDRAGDQLARRTSSVTSRSAVT